MYPWLINTAELVKQEMETAWTYAPLLDNKSLA